MRLFRPAIKHKKALMGMLFTLPWLAGFIFLFAVPLFQSLLYSFHDLKLGERGLEMSYAGWGNFIHAFTVHASFPRVLTESVTGMLIQVPLIIFFSLFVATILNQKFIGRSAARVVFFLPVIVATGVIASMNSDFLSLALGNVMESGNQKYHMVTSEDLMFFLVDMGVHPGLIDYLADAVDRIYEVISSSSVQILIFLAALQSIPGALYEAAKIEGATGYESFWKITFPMVSPIILTNVIYTVIDSFLNSPMSALLQTTSFTLFQFGLGAAMAWVYFLVIALILLLFTFIISRRVFYYN